LEKGLYLVAARKGTYRHAGQGCDNSLGNQEAIFLTRHTHHNTTERAAYVLRLAGD
jgi:hypothetical protein